MPEGKPPLNTPIIAHCRQTEVQCFRLSRRGERARIHGPAPEEARENDEAIRPSPDLRDCIVVRPTAPLFPSPILWGQTYEIHPLRDAPESESQHADLRSTAGRNGGQRDGEKPRSGRVSAGGPDGDKKNTSTTTHDTCTTPAPHDALHTTPRHAPHCARPLPFIDYDSAHRFVIVNITRYVEYKVLKVVVYAFTGDMKRRPAWLFENDGASDV